MAEVELECAVYGEGTVFPVKIARDAKVSALQEAIFEKQRYHERFSFPPSALTLYLAKKDGAWLKDDRRVKNFLQAGKSTEYEEEMRPSWKLDDDELFGKDFEPGDKEIQILVELPSHVAISVTDAVVEKAKKQNAKDWSSSADVIYLGSLWQFLSSVFIAEKVPQEKKDL